METSRGKLLVLLPGLGAVATTFLAGVELCRRSAATPIGSMSQLGTVRLGRRDQHRVVPIHDLVPLAPLDDLVFGAWDIVHEDAAEVAERCAVLTREDRTQTESFLRSIRPRPGAHDPDRVRRIKADHVIECRGHRAVIDRLRRDIDQMKAESGASRAVMICTASTETLRGLPWFADDPADFERALDEDDPAIAPTMLYAYAALREGVPFANATPNRSIDLPALQHLATDLRIPVAGKDLKTGQTMMKTVLAPALKARLLGLRGWFSTNILGNRDGEVLDDPEAFRSKEITKIGVLDTLLQPDIYPELYGDLDHKVTIHYYPPRGDQKEGWDAIDLFGWLGYPMQIKIDFQCRDSVLAAPLVLDLALFLDLAHRAEWRGIQEWLSFYFKSPMAADGVYPEHDLFIQHAKLKNTLRVLAGEPPLTHLGLDYYGDQLPIPEPACPSKP